MVLEEEAVSKLPQKVQENVSVLVPKWLQICEELWLFERWLLEFAENEAVEKVAGAQWFRLHLLVIPDDAWHQYSLKNLLHKAQVNFQKNQFQVLLEELLNEAVECQVYLRVVLDLRNVLVQNGFENERAELRKTVVVVKVADSEVYIPASDTFWKHGHQDF